MSESRQFDEYLDPDYTQFQPKQQTIAETNPNCSNKSPKSSPEARQKAINKIIDREFQRELKSKEDELDEINQRLDDAKQLLAKVRYAVVHNYYSRKSLLCSEEEIAEVEKCERESMTNIINPNDSGSSRQLAIHPSLKKLLGKRPIDYNEILKTRSPRQAAKNATEQFHKLAKKPHALAKEAAMKLDEDIINQNPVDDVIKKETMHSLDSNFEQIPKKPRYVAPSTSALASAIPQITSARGRNLYRHLLVVGNTSKYIGDEEFGLKTNVTHKWLVYIATKSDVSIEKIVSRVRFYLDETYKPNDIIEISSPPFQLAKRGWGEFFIRVKLYFHDHLLQKPIQIAHKLALDKEHSGLQKMGAETVVELWLNIPNTVSESGENSKSLATTPEPTTSNQLDSESVNQSESIETIKHEKPDDETNAVTSIQIPEQQLSQKICDQMPCIPLPNPIAKPTLIALPKLLPTVTNGPGKKLIKCVTKDGKISFIQLVQDANNPKIFKMSVPKQPIIVSQLSPINNGTAANSQPSPSLITQNLMNQTNVQRPQIVTIPSNSLKRPNTTPLHPLDLINKVVVLDAKRQQSTQQRSLLKPQISLLKSSVLKNNSANKPNGNVITVSNIPGLNHKNINVILPPATNLANQSTSGLQKQFRSHAIELEKCFYSIESFANMTEAVTWLFKKLPLINSEAGKSEFRESFPFVVASVDDFYSILPAKQRSFEWLRAKYINTLVSKHKHLINFKKWSTKEIIIYGRWYGYTPQSTIIRNAPVQQAEPNVRDMIKSELIREHLQNDTISFNTRMNNWIQVIEETTLKGSNSTFKTIEDQIIIVDDDDRNDSDETKKSINQLTQQKQSNLTHLLTDNRYQNELMWINDICRRSQIRFEPEQIEEGILHNSSELMLVVALRSFVEDLLRQSCGNKFKSNNSQSSTSDVTTNDVLQTISNIPHFDFLTNKHLGVDRLDKK